MTTTLRTIFGVVMNDAMHRDPCTKSAAVYSHLLPTELGKQEFQLPWQRFHLCDFFLIISSSTNVTSSCFFMHFDGLGLLIVFGLAALRYSKQPHRIRCVYLCDSGHYSVGSLIIFALYGVTHRRKAEVSTYRGNCIS